MILDGLQIIHIRGFAENDIQSSMIFKTPSKFYTLENKSYQVKTRTTKVVLEAQGEYVQRRVCFVNIQS